MYRILSFGQRSLSHSDAEVPDDEPLHRPVKLILLAAFVAICYYIGTEVGFRFTPAGDTISTLWPPNAILFASLLLIPRRHWWLVLLMTLPAHLMSQIRNGVGLARSLGWYASNCSEAVIGAYCILFFDKSRLKFNRVRGTLVFLIFGFLLAPLLTSFMDAGVVVATGRNANYWTMWTRRLFTNMLSVLTIVPPLVVIGRVRINEVRASQAWRVLELICIVTAIALLHIDTFGKDRLWAMTYAQLPLLIWATARHGPAGLSVAVLTGVILSIWEAIHGHGSLASVSARENVLFFQISTSIMVVPLMLLSAMLSESRKTERALRDSKAKMFEAQEDERRRIARELHDDLGQQLVLAEFQLAEIKAEVSSAVTPLVNQLSKQLLEISTDIREISHGLYPSLLQKLGLTAALRRLSQEISADQGFEVTFVSTVNESVPPHVAVALYRVAQEALQNVAKHSRARHVQMELRGAGDGLTLRVRDDGIGFDLTQQTAGGLGLDNMRERLWGIGGTLQIDSVPKEGTDIQAFVSFAQTDSELE